MCLDMCVSDYHTSPFCQCWFVHCILKYNVVSMRGGGRKEQKFVEKMYDVTFLVFFFFFFFLILLFIDSVISSSSSIITFTCECISLSLLYYIIYHDITKS